MKKTLLCILLFLAVNSPIFSQNSEIESEKEGAKQAALDYIDGAHEGNAERMERGIHPELNKITLRKLPNSEKTVLFKAGSSRLIELIRANVAPLEKEKRNIKVTIYTVKEGLACVKVVSAMFYDYLLLAKMGMLEAGKRNIKVTIFDVREDIAMAEVLSTMYYDYLQLAKLDGQWKIVNVLWKMNPDAPRPDRE